MADRIIDTLNAATNTDFKDDAQINKVVAAAQSLIARIQSPIERMRDISFFHMILVSCLKICHDVGLFQKWKSTGRKQMTVGELAKLVDADPKLLTRVLRHVASQHIIEETGLGTYSPTATSLALAEPEYYAWVNFIYTPLLPLYQKLPEFVRQHKYAEPLDTSDAPFQYTFDSKGSTFYDRLKAHPEETKTFDDMMRSYSTTHETWLDFYPSEELIDGSDAPVLVDVGGCFGYELQKFLDKHPGVGKRLILQDLEAECARAVVGKTDEVVVMPHDFFTPQPVYGARAYYLHSVLHNWSDDQCVKILARLKDAMAPGFSKVLTHEYVIADRHPDPRSTSADMNMMVIFATKERSETDFKNLLEAAGLKMTKIWYGSEAIEGVVEAEVA